MMSFTTRVAELRLVAKAALLSVGIIVSAQSALAQEKLLPLQTLRDQSSTAHCWAYATSHMLESRALTRESEKILINVEKDVKYWVDFERMLYIFRSKKNFYLGSYEGAWQIEYWESFLKHGKHIMSNEVTTPDIWYQPFKSFTKGLPFMAEPRPQPDPKLMPIDRVPDHLRAMKSETEALAFITDYLNRWYGKPVIETKWSGASVSIQESASRVLGKDFGADMSVESMLLVKPVSDEKFGWVRYLDERYWGYRYDSSKVLDLIKLSLDRNWPVTFDNVGHAMTIIAYSSQKGQDYFAVADSAPATISWYSATSMFNNLNLVTFYFKAIQDQIPPKSRATAAALPEGVDVDQLDNTQIPPGVIR